jgi:hypothetical protein
MSYGGNPPVLEFWPELMQAGDSMKQIPMEIVQYIPYVMGYGFINFVGDWLKDVRPLSNYEMTDNFYRHVTEGVIDVAKMAYWGNYTAVGPGGGGSKPMYYPSSPGWGWGSSYSMHGMQNPGVNRVAGQY